MVNLTRLSRRMRRRRATRRAGVRSVPVLRSTALGLRRSRTGPRQPVQYFKRTTYQVNFIQSGALDSFQNLVFQLNQLPNYTEFTSLYDQYQIKGIKFVLMPRFNSGEVALSSCPPTWSILDYDGSFPVNNASMLQYQNLKMKTGYGNHARYLKPAISAELYESPVGTAYGPKKNVWIDAQYPDVPHYGATVMIPANVGPGENVFWDLKITYYLAFKNVR